jgi:ABC-2 type transport system permease protein
LFLLVTLGMGVLISTVSQNQGQAIQLAIMFVVPQILLSGLIFPISSMAAGVRWIAYVLPLSYFIDISRGVMLKDTPITALWEPLLVLAGMAMVVLGLAMLRFRRDLAPSTRRSRVMAPGPGPVST